MITELEDCFIKKCPACTSLLRKQSLHAEHSCVCGYAWTATLNGTPYMKDISKTEI